MKTCAIMQPTYLPWAGYFNLIRSVDIFILLDDVQFERRSWQQRNRIPVNGVEHKLTVPVKHCPRETRIADIVVDDSTSWRSKHLALLERTYMKHPFGKDVVELLRPIISDMTLSRLAELNGKIIRSVALRLGLGTEIALASELNVGGTRSSHLYLICQRVGADHYLSPRGSMDYLETDGVFTATDVCLQYQNFAPVPYPQHGMREFMSHLSIVDVVANLGWETASAYCRGQGIADNLHI